MHKFIKKLLFFISCFIIQVLFTFYLPQLLGIEERVFPKDCINYYQRDFQNCFIKEMNLE